MENIRLAIRILALVFILRTLKGLLLATFRSPFGGQAHRLRLRSAGSVTVELLGDGPGGFTEQRHGAFTERLVYP